MGLDRRKVEKLNLEDRLEWENKTITSAIKTYLRQLPEPLMSFRYHTAFIAAASKSLQYPNISFIQHVYTTFLSFLFSEQESRLHRTADVHALVHRLPENHFKMLDIMITHLKKCVNFMFECTNIELNIYILFLCSVIVSQQNQTRI